MSIVHSFIAATSDGLLIILCGVSFMLVALTVAVLGSPELQSATSLAGAAVGSLVAVLGLIQMVRDVVDFVTASPDLAAFFIGVASSMSALVIVLLMVYALSRVGRG